LSPPAPFDGVPATVKQLLVEDVTDFDELELLLLLQRDAARTWTVDAAAEQRRVPVAVVERAADALCARRLIAADADGYRFAPSTPALRDACEQLRAAYDEDRYEIVALMSRLAVERMRNSAARAFASAFKIRKPTGGA
jgi:hypothetical protein